MRVFLSSTAQDLVDYRSVADDTILRLSQESVAMERFGPLPGEPVAECERKARESDVVVCIVAHRYGFVPEKGGGEADAAQVWGGNRAMAGPDAPGARLRLPALNRMPADRPRHAGTAVHIHDHRMQFH